MEDEEEFQKELLLDPLWQLEMASIQLETDINFLHCIEEAYLTDKELKGEQWLRWQMENIIPTLRKSIESTQIKMKKSISEIYKNTRKEKENE